MKSILVSFLVAISSSVWAVDFLPILHQNDVILFQGDSITEGGRARTGNDYNHIMGQDYAYIIAAQLGAQYPERNLTFINRGISGNKITDLAARWQADTLDLKPNVLSILVGVNDSLGLLDGNGGIPADQYEQVYEKLLTNTLATLTGVKIVLCEPFMLPVGKWKNNFSEAQSELKKHQEIVARLAAKYHLPLVRFQQAFDDACQKAPPEHWVWDGVHPTYAGHGLMVQEWLRTVNAFWPKEN